MVAGCHVSEVSHGFEATLRLNTWLKCRQLREGEGPGEVDFLAFELLARLPGVGEGRVQAHE
jgi:hypothetical protein